jgi:hypothetical protein
MARHAKEVCRSVYETNGFPHGVGVRDTPCEGSTRRLISARDQPARPNRAPMARADRQLAQGASFQWAYRDNEQSHQADQTNRFRTCELPTPLRPLIDLCRQTKLGPIGQHHTPLKSEEPVHCLRRFSRSQAQRPPGRQRAVWAYAAAKGPVSGSSLPRVVPVAVGAGLHPVSALLEGASPGGFRPMQSSEWPTAVTDPSWAGRSRVG